MNKMNYDYNTITRFWKKVDIPNNLLDCWIWNAYTNEKGYGKFGLNHKMIFSHRFSYEYYYGPILNDLNVLHHCDNPPCVNPNHLFLGTIQDNSNDMVSKGRSCIGSKNNTHLTEYQVEQMLIDIYNKKYININEIVNSYNIGRTTILNILHGNTWKHVTNKLQIPLFQISNMILCNHDISGSNNPKSKLEYDDIIIIKNRLKNGDQPKQIAIDFNITVGTIYHINTGKTWSHVNI